MNKPTYQCAVCSAWFDNEVDYHKHEQEFHNPQEDAEVSLRAAGGPFPCVECGAEFESAELMEDHLVQLHPERDGMGKPPLQHRRGSKGSFRG